MDDPLLLATGKVLALIATIFEREELIERGEFGNLIEVFASLTGETHPQQGDIMAIWAAMIRDRSPPTGGGAQPRPHFEVLNGGRSEDHMRQSHT